MSEDIYRLVPESILRSLFAAAALKGKHLNVREKNAKTRQFLDAFAWCKPVVVSTVLQHPPTDPTQAPKPQQAAASPTPPFSAEEVTKAAQ